MINGRLIKNDLGGNSHGFFHDRGTSVHSRGGTKENNGKLCSVPRVIFDPGTSRSQECKLEPTCLDPNKYKNEICISVYQFLEQ